MRKRLDHLKTVVVAVLTLLSLHTHVPASPRAVDDGAGGVQAPAAAQPPTRAKAAPAKSCAGARAVKTGGCTVATRSGRFVGNPEDRASIYARDCRAEPPGYRVRQCALTSTGSVSVAFVGNSRAAQWSDAMAAVARARGWRVTTFLSSGCAPNAYVPAYRNHTEAKACHRWGKAVQRAVLRSGVDLVVFSSSSTAMRGGKEPAAGFTAWFRPLADAGVGVVVLRAIGSLGQPGGSTVVDCLAQNPSDYRRCARSPRSVVRADPAVVGADRLGSPLVTSFGMTEFQCTKTSCPVVVGRVLAYYDGSHHTPAYVRTMVPWFRAKLTAAVASVTGARAAP